MTSNARQHAEDLLVHYIREAWQAAGLDWGSDNDTEVRLIIDYLTDAAYEQARNATAGEPR